MTDQRQPAEPATEAGDSAWHDGYWVGYEHGHRARRETALDVKRLADAVSGYVCGADELPHHDSVDEFAADVAAEYARLAALREAQEVVAP